MNCYFFFGLFEYEVYFVKYEAGDFYFKYFDLFCGNENCKLIMVFYFNENWIFVDGGELKIYDL